MGKIPNEKCLLFFVVGAGGVEGCRIGDTIMFEVRVRAAYDWESELCGGGNRGADDDGNNKARGGQGQGRLLLSPAEEYRYLLLPRLPAVACITPRMPTLSLLLVQ